MATRGLISSLFVGIWIAFLLADCSSFPRKSFTREQQDLAGIPGIADARIWADDPTGLSRTESVLLQKVVFKNAAKPKLYIIVNGKITSDFAVIGDGTLSIVARSFYSSVKANTRNTLIATYDFARRNGWQFRLAAIQSDYAMTSTTFNFDTDYMRGLFNLGFSTGRTGQQWQSSLKALAASPSTGRL